MVKLQNVECCMKVDLFFFQYLCVFTFAFIFLYFVAQYDVDKMWAKRTITARMLLSISGKNFFFSHGLHYNEKASFPNPLRL